MLLKLIPDNTHIGFTRLRFIALIFSGLLVVGSLIAIFTLGFNFGVDFKGGVTIEVADDQPIDLAEVRDVMNNLNLGSIDVQEIFKMRARLNEFISDP